MRTVIVCLVAVLAFSVRTGAIAQENADQPPAPIRLTVSEETTVLTKPLTDDGYVDFVRALDEQLESDITPDINAAVQIWQALGPDEIPQQDRRTFFRRLGVAPPQIVGEYFIDFGDFTLVPPEGVEADEWRTMLTEQQAQATMRPWTPEEFPDIARWVELNDPPLTLVESAVRRRRFYSPLVGSSPLFGMRLLGVQKARSVARALVARSMLHLAEGRTNEAGSDLITVHQLARLVGQGPTLIEMLVATAIESMACAGDVALLQQGPLPAAQARSILAKLNALPPIPEAAQAVDQWERLAILDFYCHVVRTRDSELAYGWSENTLVQKAFVEMLRRPESCDWDAPLLVCNRWCDRAVEAMRIDSRRERRDALERLTSELRQLQQDAGNEKRLEQELAAADRAERGEIIGNLLVSTLMPGFSQAREAQDRGTATLRLSRAAAALAVRRAEDGEYPTTLDEVGPSDPAALIDPFTDAMFVYRLDGDGFVLYSLGSNEQDDGGRTYGEGDGADDLVVRVSSPHRD